MVHVKISFPFQTPMTFLICITLLMHNFCLQILHYEMDVQPQQAVVSTVASVVLHNIGIIRGDIINYETSTNLGIDDDENSTQHLQDGSLIREHIVQNYFT